MTQNSHLVNLQHLKKVKIPQKNSHKGQIGKLLIIGGSELFHAASKWSLDVASKFVDMLFYSSVPENNELIQKAKGEFWNGIVIPRGKIDEYIDEADCVLIGPGMERNAGMEYGRISHGNSSAPQIWTQKPTPEEWQNDTTRIVNYLLTTYPDKKWVVDAGALQMVDPSLLNKNCIITPHQRELGRVWENLDAKNNNEDALTPDSPISLLKKTQEKLSCTILLKGNEDLVGFSGIDKPIIVSGGNPGMTKGGTGDVLSGLVAALYCTHDALTSAVVGSYVNKKAGDTLFERVGPYFNASDLVDMIPEVMWKEISHL